MLRQTPKTDYHAIAYFSPGISITRWKDIIQMTISPLRVHWLAVVTALAIAVILSACSEPTATPTSAPTYTPTPEPTATPTPEPMPIQVSTPAYSGELEALQQKSNLNQKS